jgi:hypothetical protein
MVFGFYQKTTGLLICKQSALPQRNVHKEILGKLTALRADIAAKYGAPVYLKRYWSQNF